MAVRGFFLNFLKFFFEKFPEKTTPLMEVLRPVLDSSRDGLFGGMKQKKKIDDGNIFARTDFWSTLFLKNVPDVKMGKNQRIWTAHIESFQNPVSDPRSDE